MNKSEIIRRNQENV